jgi:hypothetical protein
LAKLAVRTPEPPVLTRTFEAMDRFYEGLGPEKIRNIRVFSGGDSVWQTRALLWKELRTRASGKLRNSVRLSLILLILSSAVFWLGLEILHALMWISAVATFLLALSNGVGLFVMEKEERKWDVLLSTPLGSGEIVQAKLVAGLVPLLPTTVLLILFWGSAGWISGFYPLEVVQALLVVIFPGLLAFAAGAASSLHAASLRGAFSVAFGGLIALFVILPVLISIDVPHLLGRNDRDLLLCAISPAPYLVEFGNSMAHYGGGYWSRPESNFGAFSLFMALHAGALAGLFMHMNSSFNRITGRVAP